MRSYTADEITNPDVVRPTADSVRRWAVEQIIAHGGTRDADEIVSDAKKLEAYVLHQEKPDGEADS